MKKLTVFLAFIFLSSLGLGQVFEVDSKMIDQPAVSQMAAKDQYVYITTTQLCPNLPYTVLKRAFGETFEASSDIWMLDFKKLNSLRERNGVSSLLRHSLSSPAFPYALEKCFGHLPEPYKARAKKTFVTQMITYDFIGNTSGIYVGTIGISKLFKFAFGALNKYSWQPIRRYAEHKLLMSPKMLTLLDHAIITGAFIGGVTYSASNYLKQQRRKVEDDRNYLDTMVSSLNESFKSLELAEKALESSTDKEFWLAAKEETRTQVIKKCNDLKNDRVFEMLDRSYYQKCLAVMNSAR